MHRNLASRARKGKVGQSHRALDVDVFTDPFRALAHKGSAALPNCALNG